MKRLLKIGLISWLILMQVGSHGFLFQRSHALMTCNQPFQSVSAPLIDLKNDEYLRLGSISTGVTGGLYPNRSNERPLSHEEAGLRQAAKIQPLDANGNLDLVNGRVVMLTIGMSNTDQESRNFVQRVSADKSSNNGVVVQHFFAVNGAEPGQSADKWVDVNDTNWSNAKARLGQFQMGGHPDLTAEQVQVVWIKQAHPMINRTTAFPDHVEDLQADLEQIAQNVLVHFPNVKIAYFSSRTRSYGYWNGDVDDWGFLSPEPAAFETGFAVKWMIEKQINGDSSLNFEPTLGTVNAPLLLWGPYIWADSSPRSDGFIWTQADLENDCTHPSASGEEKIGAELFSFFSSDSTAVSWFTGAPIDPPDPPNPPIDPPGPPEAEDPLIFLPLIKNQ